MNGKPVNVSEKPEGFPKLHKKIKDITVTEYPELSATINGVVAQFTDFFEDLVCDDWNFGENIPEAAHEFSGLEVADFNQTSLQVPPRLKLRTLCNAVSAMIADLRTRVKEGDESNEGKLLFSLVEAQREVAALLKREHPSLFPEQFRFKVGGTVTGKLLVAKSPKEGKLDLDFSLPTHGAYTIVEDGEDTKLNQSPSVHVVTSPRSSARLRVSRPSWFNMPKLNYSDIRFQVARIEKAGIGGKSVHIYVTTDVPADFAE